MIIKKTSDKKVVWGFRYRYKVDGKWMKKEIYNKSWTKRQAEQEEIEFIKSLETPTGETLLFSELYDMYFEFKKDKIKKRSYNDTKQMCDNHILPLFKDYLVNDIRTHEIETFQKQLLKSSHVKKGEKVLYSSSMIDKIQISFNSILNFGFDRDLVYRNPFRVTGFVSRKAEVTEEERRYITVEEFNRIIRAIKVTEHHGLTKEQNALVVAQDSVIFSILFWCGLRKGELMALDIKDYNFITKELKVYKTWDYQNKLITTPKTDNSVRTVIVPDIVDQYIIELVAMYKRLPDYSIDCPLITFDKRMAPTTLTRKKDKYCKLAGIEGVTVHDFRHSHVSLLINSGLQPFEIAKRLGHTVEMVNEVYGHLYPSKQREMVEMMNSIN